MSRFQPRFWPTVIMLTMMAIVIGLGTWQLHRRAWKTELLATIAQRMGGEAVALPAAIDTPSDWTFRRVTVAGRFDPDHTIWLYGRTHDGKVGVHLLVPLIRDQGAPILVDRGFVPFEHGSTLAGFAPAPESATVDGIVRQPESGGLFMPSSRPDQNVWYGVDIAAMSKAVGRTLAPVYIAARAVSVQTGGDVAEWPAATGGTEGTGIRNEHLNYAIFWYSMAVVLAVIYVISSRSRRS
jgi:surfeit locus 1 family protein